MAGAPLMVGAGFGIEGIRELEKLAADLQQIGSSDLKREFLMSARHMARPAGEAFKRAEIANLPHAGGLGTTVATLMTTTTQVRFRGKRIGVSFKTRYRGHDMKGLEAGLVRYPLYGDRGHWYSHPVPANLIWGAAMMMRDDVRAAFLAAVDATIARLRAGGP